MVFMKRSQKWITGTLFFVVGALLLWAGTTLHSSLGLRLKTGAFVLMLFGLALQVWWLVARHHDSGGAEEKPGIITAKR